MEVFLMKNFLSKTLSGVSRVKSLGVMLLVLIAATVVQAQENAYSQLAAGVETEIASAKTILLGIGAAIIGVAVVFVIYRFVRGMVSR
jgi:hypothetical protein